MGDLEDKTYKQACEELFERVRQEIQGEVDIRAVGMVGNTVASLVEDMPEGPRKEGVRSILLLAKMDVALELARKRNPLLWFEGLRRDEAEELSGFVSDLCLKAMK